MAEGKIKRLVPDRGFGFIRDMDSKQEFFFHRSSVERPDRFDNLEEGDAVEFEEVSGDGKGPRADHVRRV